MISSNTVSAGEYQALALAALPQTTLLGETTFGIFSEAIPKQLPNGWQFTLSTQRVYSSNGIFYEQKGIPANIEVLPDAEQLQLGRDNMLDAALMELGLAP